MVSIMIWVDVLIIVFGDFWVDWFALSVSLRRLENHLKSDS